MPDCFSMDDPGSVAAILMASGFSERFGGRNKLLVPFRGKPLVRYTLELACSFNGLFSEPTNDSFENAPGFPGGIFFVAASNEVIALASDLPMVRSIKNLSPEKGLRESVRLGVEAAANAAYYLFFPCDMPFLDEDTVRCILEARRPGCIVEPRFRERPVNPCLFSAHFRENLLSLKEGETPRKIKASNPEAIRIVDIPKPLPVTDIDDEEKFRKLEL